MRAITIKAQRKQSGLNLLLSFCTLVCMCQPLSTRAQRTNDTLRESLQLALSKVDAANEDLFNRILWRSIKGEAAGYPGPRRMSSLEYTRAR